jgi:two-component system nitrogen regulation response regulator GlnG
MSLPDASQSTLPEVELPCARDTPLCRLTILYHPETDRIGEVLDQDGGESLSLGRNDGYFQPPRGGEALPLQDPFLSRKPLRVDTAPDGLVLLRPRHGSSLSVNGVVVNEQRRVSRAELERGVVLVLARRILLYLHLPDGVPPVPDDCGLVGEADALQALRRLICQGAAKSRQVLLLGESGTGKELVARALFERSDRASRPFVTVNMAAVPPDLAAAELFGVRRGAFTGADRDKPGFFRLADGGTLFLDEIGATTPGVQAQLLRVLESGEIQSPGGAVERVDVRVLSATDARVDAEGGGFSTALRHRLGAFEIRLPPLRERIEDLGRLMSSFLGDFLRHPRFEEPALVGQWVLLVSQLAAFSWPGNVRQLRNFCEQVVVASDGSAGLRVPDSILRTLEAESNVTTAYPGETVSTQRRRVAELKDQQVRQAMAQENWEVTAAARRLRISRSALYRRIAAIPGLSLAADIPGEEIGRVLRQHGGDLPAAAAALRVSATALRDRCEALELLPRRSG